MDRFLNFSVAFCVAAISTAAACTAQDKVVLQRPNLSSRLTISGFVEDYTGTEVSIRTEAGEPPRTFPSAEVVEIQTAHVEAHTQGLNLLAEGQVDEAIRELETALKKESRTWVRREILATIVRCGLRRGDYVLAGSRFLALVKSDPTTRQFRTIPLIWAPETISRDARAEARVWIQGPVEAARLIGASLLFEDSEAGPEARTAFSKIWHRAPIRECGRWLRCRPGGPRSSAAIPVSCRPRSGSAASTSCPKTCAQVPHTCWDALMRCDTITSWRRPHYYGCH